MEPEVKPLNPRQKKFLACYLANGGNAAAAAREAGYANPNQEAYRLIRLPQIAAAVKEHLDQAAMSAEEVLARLAAHARGDIADFIDIEGDTVQRGKRKVPLREPWALNLKRARDAGLLHLVKKISYDKNGNPALELYDAQAALALLGKHHKLFTEKVEHSGPGGGALPFALALIGELDPNDVKERLRAAREHLAAGGLPDAP